MDSESNLMEEDNQLESSITYGATTQAEKVGKFILNEGLNYQMCCHLNRPTTII